MQFIQGCLCLKTFFTKLRLKTFEVFLFTVLDLSDAPIETSRLVTNVACLFCFFLTLVQGILRYGIRWWLKRSNRQLCNSSKGIIKLSVIIWPSVDILPLSSWIFRFN